MVGTTGVKVSGNTIVDDLLGSRHWTGEAVSFGFSQAASIYGKSYGRGEADSFKALNKAQEASAREAMQLWSELIDIDLVEAKAAEAEIRIGVSSDPTTAWAYMPSMLATGGDVWLGTKYLANPKQGNYAHFTIMHEIGHALGLAHPHEAGAKLSGATPDDGLCPCCAGLLHGQGNASGTGLVSTTTSAIDAMDHSVMSYRSYAGQAISTGYTNETFGYAQSPMVRDIAAIQHLYGANYETRATDTVYRWSETTGEKFIDGEGQGKPGANKVFETVWDGGGRDTFDLSNFTTDLHIDLTPGGWTDFGTNQRAYLGNGHYATGNVAVAMLHQDNPLALIENAIGGSGDDTIIGNAGDNLIVGNAGHDVIDGGDGRNILVGDGVGNELDLIGLAHADFSPALLPAQPKMGGDDVLFGGQHNDIFIPGFGNNEVHGGEGTDTLVLDLSLEALTLTEANGVLSIVYDFGSVELTGVEILAVADGIFSLVGPLSGLESREFVDEITLLYRAGLGRAPDASGLDYWADALEGGTQVEQIALSLLDSPEFAERFGTEQTLSDADFLNALYRNVLNREGDADGLAYWQGQMDDGATRGDLLLAFTYSDENRDNAVAEGNDLGLVAVSHAQWAELWS